MPPPRDSLTRVLLIYGAGGLARELAWLVAHINRDQRRWDLAAFISDVPAEQAAEVDGIPVLSLDGAVRRHPSALAVVGVGSPSARQALAGRLADAGLQTTTLIHPDLLWSERSKLGAGCVLQVGSQVTVGVELGAHVLLNGNLTTGHDCRVGDYSVLGPGCNISGNVVIGKRVMIGTGATVTEGRPGRPLTIGDDAVVGAGACVVRDVPAGTTVVGVPARALERG